MVVRAIVPGSGGPTAILVYWGISPIIEYFVITFHGIAKGHFTYIATIFAANLSVVRILRGSIGMSVVFGNFTVLSALTVWDFIVEDKKSRSSIEQKTVASGESLYDVRISARPLSYPISNSFFRNGIRSNTISHTLKTIFTFGFNFSAHGAEYIVGYIENRFKSIHEKSCN